MMEKYIWSLDISTTNIGSALWDSKGNLVELKHLELKIDKNIPTEERYIYKSEIFRKYVLDYNNKILNELNGEISHVIVEEPLFGSNNSNTVSLLFGFNGICCYILYTILGIIPKKISVHDSRVLFLPEIVKISYKKGEKVETLSFPKEYKEDKKKFIWEKVSKLHPEIQWFYDKNGKIKDINYDMSDSYCVGYAGLKLLNIK